VEVLKYNLISASFTLEPHFQGQDLPTQVSYVIESFSWRSYEYSNAENDIYHSLDGDHPHELYAYQSFYEALREESNEAEAAGRAFIAAEDFSDDRAAAYRRM